MANATPEIDAAMRILLANDSCGVLPKDEMASGQLQLGDGDELLFLVNKKFAEAFREQVKATHAVAYDFSWVMANENIEDEGAQMAFKKLKDEAH